MADHTVQPGDCFNSLAEQYGFYNYLTLYAHAENLGLRGRRANPNQLAEGDTVAIPAKQQKRLALVLDGEKRFKVDRRLTRLRLRITDLAGKPLTVTACALEAGGASTAALPDGEGLVELTIPANARTGKLVVKATLTRQPPTPPRPGTPPGTAPPFPPHPPEIVATQFTDEQEKPTELDAELTWNLRLGYLEPSATTRGALQRLHNLGCRVQIGTAENEETARVVLSYQRFLKKKPETGKAADLSAALQSAHDGE